MRIKDKYFNWICGLIDYDESDDILSHLELLRYLFDIEFIYIIDKDADRAIDGIDLRYRFGYEMGYSRDFIERHLDDKPCSVLEMMVALSIRCENITDNPYDNDRAEQWFWTMIKNLGLYDMTDSTFDEEHISHIIDKFLNRKYSYNGEGGLFTVKNPKEDMRDVEIWYQTMWYLDDYLNLK